jgi:hypothetical protein
MEQTGATSRTFTQQSRRGLKTALSGCPYRPFLVTLEQSPSARAKLNVHIAREVVSAASGAHTSSHRLVKRRIVGHVKPLGLDASIQVRLYSRHSLDKPRSLEELIFWFGRGERLYDPTGAFEEAERLVALAGHLRRQLGGDLKGIYWSSRLQATCVLLKEKAFVDGHRLRREKLIAAERSVVNVYQASARRKFVERGNHAANPVPDQLGSAESVRLCFDLPAVPVVPIDAASVIHRSFVRLPTLGTLFGLGSMNMPANNSMAENRSITSADTAITTSIASAEDAAKYGDDGAPAPSDGGNLFAGGPGLHLLWRDPINGAIGENTPAHQACLGALPSRPAGDKMGPSPDQLFNAATTHESSRTSTSTTRSFVLDLRWLVDGMTIDAAESDMFPNQAKPSAPSVMQPAIAAMLGRSDLMRGDPLGEAYAATLEDLRAHFGLPRSIQAEARWHFRNVAQSSTAQPRLDALQRETPFARSESYSEWLGRMAAKNSPSRGRDQLQTRFRIRSPSAVSSR